MQRTPSLPIEFKVSVLTIVFLLGVTACTASNLSSETATATSMPATSMASATTIREPSSPPNCSQLEITQLIDSFAKAYDAGSFEQITQYLDLDRFEYFVGGTKAGKSYEEIRTSSRTELFAYFAQRHAQHEEIQRLEPLVVSPTDNPTGRMLITFILSRRADDFPEVQAGGKAIVDCQSGKLSRFIWYGFDLP